MHDISGAISKVPTPWNDKQDCSRHYVVRISTCNIKGAFKLQVFNRWICFTYLGTYVQYAHSSTTNAIANRVIFCSVVTTVVLPIFNEFVVGNVFQHLFLSYEEEIVSILFANAFWSRRVLYRECSEIRSWQSITNKRIKFTLAVVWHTCLSDWFFSTVACSSECNSQFLLSWSHITTCQNSVSVSSRSTYRKNVYRDRIKK